MYGALTWAVLGFHFLKILNVSYIKILSNLLFWIHVLFSSVSIFVYSRNVIYISILEWQELLP